MSDSFNVSHAKVRKAALTYLRRVGFEIREEEYPADGFDLPLVVAYDPERRALHFVEITDTTVLDNWIINSTLEDCCRNVDLLSAFERVLVSYFSEHPDDVDMSVLLSRLQLLVMSPDRAIIRFERSLISKEV